MSIIAARGRTVGVLEETSTLSSLKSQLYMPEVSSTLIRRQRKYNIRAIGWIGHPTVFDYFKNDLAHYGDFDITWKCLHESPGRITSLGPLQMLLMLERLGDVRWGDNKASIVPVFIASFSHKRNVDGTYSIESKVQDCGNTKPWVFISDDKVELSISKVPLTSVQFIKSITI